MIVDWNTMHDVEKQVLNDANNLFFFRVVALNGTEGFGQNAIDSPWHIHQILDEEICPWSLANLQRLHQHLHQMALQFRFFIFI